MSLIEDSTVIIQAPGNRVHIIVLLHVFNQKFHIQAPGNKVHNYICHSSPRRRNCVPLFPAPAAALVAVPHHRSLPGHPVPSAHEGAAVSQETQIHPRHHVHIGMGATGGAHSYHSAHWYHAHTLADYSLHGSQC